MIIEAFLGILS